VLRVTPLQAREGMELALPLGHPVRTDRVLLSAGSKLTPRSIRRLREIGIEHLWIRYPGLEDLERWVSPALAEAQLGLRRCVARAFDGLDRQNGSRLEFAAYRRAVTTMVSRLLDRRSAAVLIEEIGSAHKPALRHAGNVCYLSLLLGLRLDAYLMIERRRLSGAAAREVSGLGVAGMLHDVGIGRLSRETLEQWATHPEHDDKHWQLHARLSYEASRAGLDPASASAVLHHHQRFDGSGFPERLTISGESEPLAGRGIHVFARVLAAADLFDQLRSGTDGASPVTSDLVTADGPISTVRALRLFQEAPISDWLDPIVLLGLLSVVPPFAPGTIVRLNSGDHAVVSGWDPSDPCRPKVRIINDPDRLVEGESDLRELDLQLMRGVYICEAEGRDVEADLFGPVPAGRELDRRISAMGPDPGMLRIGA